MINHQGRIVLVNAQTEKLFGYSRAELLGQLVEALVPERFRPRHPEYRETFFNQPTMRAMGVGRDLFGRRKDGSEFPVEIGLNPIETDEGTFVLSAIVDITERKQAEAAIREAERELRQAHDELEARVQERTAEVRRTARFLDSIVENLPIMLFVKNAATLQ